MNALSVASAKNITGVKTHDGKQVLFDIAPVHFEFFETYDIKPLAGRLFERDRGAADNPPLPQQRAAPARPASAAAIFGSPRPVILNETAVRTYGFASA